MDIIQKIRNLGLVSQTVLDQPRGFVLQNQEQALVIPGPAGAYSSNSGVNQERLLRERRGQNRLRGSW
jgi:hypothetical protein